MKITSLKRWKSVLMWALLASCVSMVGMIVGYIDASNEQTICVNLPGMRPILTGNSEPIVYRITGNGVDTGYVRTEATFEYGVGGEVNGQDVYVTGGCFQTQQLSNGEYIIEFAQDGTTDYLSNFERFDISSTDQIIIDTDFLEGDANGDNVISGADASILVASLNLNDPLCEGDRGYYAIADFNEDGCVTQADRELLNANLNIFSPIRGETSP